MLLNGGSANLMDSLGVGEGALVPAMAVTETVGRAGGGVGVVVGGVLSSSLLLVGVFSSLLGFTGSEVPGEGDFDVGRANWMLVPERTRPGVLLNVTSSAYSLWIPVLEEVAAVRKKMVRNREMRTKRRERAREREERGMSRVYIVDCR